MISQKNILFFVLFLTTMLFAEVKDVDSLVEKVSQATTAQEKKILIEKVKKELTLINQKARDEADALVKAKLKQPLQSYTNP